MCGICGIVGAEEKEVLRKMSETIVHRGPDDHGFYFDESVSLANRRLSIIDLSTGKQPIHNEDETIWITYNGEVFNFMELKLDLEKKGHRFYTNTDTETIVHLYEEYGDRCAEKLRGMFAFAIWDSKNKKIILVRDRMGIKPLYYTLVSGKLIFGSEMKTILTHPEVRRKINENSLYYFLRIGFFPDPETIFSGIYQLLPGHILSFQNGKIRIRKYWDVQIRVSLKSEQYFAKKLLEILEESVKLRLISDVPLGLYLSGGIDSTTMLAVMKKYSDSAVKTFTIGFGSESDELKDARFVADYFGSDHTEIIEEGKNILKAFPRIIWHFDEPTRITTPLFFLSTVAKKKVTVVLQGLGGDELFAGYRRHNIFTYKKFIPKSLQFAKNVVQYIPVFKTVKKAILAVGSTKTEEEFYIAIRNTLTPDEEREIFQNNFLKGKKKLHEFFKPYFRQIRSKDLLDKILLLELKTNLPFDLLKITDRETMAASVEARVPMIDHKLVEFSFTIPSRLKLNKGVSKYILKKAVKDLVPKEVMTKRKQGLTLEPSTWFGEFKDFAEQILDESEIKKEKYFNYGFIENLLTKKFNSKYENSYQRLWRILSFEVWKKMYIDQDDISKPRFLF
jgi:asparagine synthase (glutamine-hydrolysing)